MKKSLEELKAIRSKKLEEINLRKGKDGYRVVVGMATCGIAAGARPVMVKLMEEVEDVLRIANTVHSLHIIIQVVKRMIFFQQKKY